MQYPVKLKEVLRGIRGGNKVHHTAEKYDVNNDARFSRLLSRLAITHWNLLRGQTMQRLGAAFK